MSSTEVATPDEQALALSATAAEAVAAAQASEYDAETLSTPILKVGQALTKEVQSGEASPGEFINTLTNETLGDRVDLIVSFYNKGRFASDQKTNRAFVSFDQEIPDAWSEHPAVGDKFVGTPFSEHPESEEAYKAAVNNNEHEWGKGPQISTTHNFTGYVVVENEDGENEYQPVRLSMKRTDVPAARKINTLVRAVLRNKPSWDVVFQLSTKAKESNGYTSYVIDPSSLKILRPTTAEEKALGAELAIAVTAGRVQASGEDADAPVEPSSGGGLAV